MDVIIATIKASPLLCLGVPVVLFAIMLAMGRPEPSEAQQAGQNSCGVIAIVVGAIFAALIIYAVLTTSEHWGTHPVSPDDLLYPYLQGGVK
jgi:hypothetical protein